MRPVSGDQILAGAALGMGHLPRSNCPIFRDWYRGSGRGARHRAHSLAPRNCPKKGRTLLLRK
jgi:hypothetical protein